MKRLVGKPIHYFLRNTDILCVGIGDEIKIQSKRLKENKHVTEYVLHIQSSWRFRKGNQIVLASDDFHRPFYDEPERTAAWQLENRTRNGEGSLFNENAKHINQNIFPLYISDIVTSSSGDLMLALSGDYYFDLFINGSRSREFYRIIDFRSGDHKVFLAESSVAG